MVIATLPTGQTIVQGHIAASKEEVWFAVSLLKYAWDFVYQLPLFGGRTVAGGTVVDFLVMTVPLPTPTYLMEKYWHTGAQYERDRILQAMIRSKIKGYAPVLEIPGEKLLDQDATDQAVLQYFGRNK